MSRQNLIILIVSIAVILTLLSLYYFRYQLGIQKVPNDFWVETDEGFRTYTRQGDNYFRQDGQYPIGNTLVTQVTKKEYLNMFKLSLKQQGFIGAEFVVEPQWAEYDN